MHIIFQIMFMKAFFWNIRSPTEESVYIIHIPGLGTSRGKSFRASTVTENSELKCNFLALGQKSNGFWSKILKINCGTS
jgi:hypothetical protein